MQMCKSMVMENTVCEHTDCSDPTNSRYYVVVVQYVAKFNSDKLRKAVQELRPEASRLSKRSFNFRLAPEDVSNKLTGFTHNAVTPFGMQTKLPVILASAIDKVEPRFIWMGAGDVDHGARDPRGIRDHRYTSATGAQRGLQHHTVWLTLCEETR